MAKISAAEKFERLYRATMSDGVIDKSEASMLIEQHNELQRLSRDALRERLSAYGHDQRGIRPESYTQWTETTPEPTEPVGDMFTTPFTDLGDTLVSWRPSERQRFFMITGPSILVTVLHLLGAF